MQAEDFMKQAGYTAKYYMRAAVDDIDEMFGKGYAKLNPELVGQYILTAAIDFHTCWTLHEKE